MRYGSVVFTYRLAFALLLAALLSPSLPPDLPAIHEARSKFWIEAAAPSEPVIGLLFCISSNSALVSGSTAYH